MKLALVLLAVLMLAVSTACASLGRGFESAGYALAPEREGGEGGAALVGSLLPEPWKTPVTAIGGAVGLGLLGIGRSIQRKLSAADAVKEGIDAAPPEAKAAVAAEVKRRARARKVNDVIEAELQGS